MSESQYSSVSPQYILYKEYLKKQIPNSMWLNDEKFEEQLIGLYGSINDNLTMIKIHVDYFNEYGHIFAYDINNKFLVDLRSNLLSILIAFPLNHIGFVHYLIRTCTESLLKMIYSMVFTDKSEEQIAKTPFRHLKDELKKEYSYAPTIKENIIILTNMYGTYSKNVHQYGEVDIFSTKFINDFFEEDSKELLKGIKSIHQMIDCYFFIINYTIKFDISSITHANRVYISNQMTEERQKYLFS
ncbi:hypothetical protein [Peribacillus simplex]|uniref:hypothetical protein n=1 Tax=Peribacillus simplex TaxID=1478 RepID=UPI003D2AD350